MDPPTDSARSSTASHLEKSATAPNLDNDDTCAEGSILSNSTGATHTAVAVSPVVAAPKKLTPAQQWAHIQPGNGPRIVPKRTPTVTSERTGPGQVVSSNQVDGLEETKLGKVKEKPSKMGQKGLNLTLHDPTEFRLRSSVARVPPEMRKVTKPVHENEPLMAELKARLLKMNQDLRRARSSTEMRTGREKKASRSSTRTDKEDPARAKAKKLTGDRIWAELTKAWKQQEKEARNKSKSAPRSILKK